MNRAKLKSYAPQARRDFIRAVTDRARKVGLTALHNEPVQVQGDVAIIGGQAFPKAVAAQRKRLDDQIQRKGFNTVMEEAAYTWFNRFMAIRYMEVHGYFEHGYRVLSYPEGGARPEFLEQAEHVDLPGLDRAKVIDLKLDGTKDEELYKYLLLAQCRALHQAMPFLFERIDDATELLLPDGLLASDSLIRKMVAEIPEDDWQQIEVIGWLYQFYISEEKARVDDLVKKGKTVDQRDIPAKTQLFTPNWIVKYMVQNSLGRQWLATYPSSSLRSKMEYYIEPAEQTEEVKAQLAAITPTSLDPETITLMDPACGSGHILVEAYDLFREIYLELGYRPRDIPRLILEKNLFGLDIDDRAAQMAGFAVLMKSRAEDRRILQDVPRLNIRAIQASASMSAAEIADVLLAPRRIELMTSGELFPETRRQPTLTVEETPPLLKSDVEELLASLADAKVVGSLLTINGSIVAKLPHFRSLLERSAADVDLLQSVAVENLDPLITQAELLSRKYSIVIANPPYMGGKAMNPQVKEFAERYFPKGKADLCAMFIERGLGMIRAEGTIAFVTMQSWMFLSSYQQLREFVIESAFIESLVQIGYNSFPEINSKIAQACAFTMRGTNFDARGVYVNLNDAPQSSDKGKIFLEKQNRSEIYIVDQPSFKTISGYPIAYWFTAKTRALFAKGKNINSLGGFKRGHSTSNNPKYLRLWHEINIDQFSFDRHDLSRRWHPYNKGGNERKWYGNREYVINWHQDGCDLRNEKSAYLRNLRCEFSALRELFITNFWNGFIQVLSIRVERSSR